MTFRLLLLILTSVSLSAVAQYCLKLGVGAAGRVGAGMDGPGLDAAGRSIAAYMLSPLVIVGLFLYALGAVVWLLVLARLPLSAAYPFVGLGFVLTMAIGLFALGEQLTPGRVAGTILIAAGCVLVARSAG